MVDIALQICTRENLKNNAIESYKQCHEKKSATNLMCMCKAVFWQASLSRGLRKGCYQRKLAQSKTYYIK